MKAVISLGGSVIGFPPNVHWLRRFREFVSEFREDIAAVVVGGGPLARELIRVASSFNVRKDILDEIGIQATIINAWIVRSALEGLVTDYVGPFYKPLSTDRIPVYGGSTLPGVTTDFVAAVLAEHEDAAFVNVTRVGGIYDKDPEKYPDAKLLRRISYNELEELALRSDKREPGTNFPIDVVALNILKRSRIKAYVVGPDIENLRRLFRGEEWTGTELVP